MVNGGNYVVRNFFDVITAKLIEPESISMALGCSVSQEIDALRYDKRQGTLELRDFDRLLEPRIKGVADSAEQLSEIAVQILTDTIMYDTEMLLIHAKQVYDEERTP